MRRLADLYDALDATTSTLEKVAALRQYFQRTPPEDAAWGLFFLLGRRLKRVISPSRLAEWTFRLTGLPGWLLEESYAAVGDLAETTALLLEPLLPAEGEEAPLHVWIEQRLLPLKALEPPAQAEAVTSLWRRLPRRELYLFHKLLTGELRVGVSDTLVVRAMAELAELEPATVAHRLMGEWEPTAAFFHSLLRPEGGEASRSRPYPFFLASPLEGEPASLGARREWLAEWKWDGIRAQLVRRGGEVFLWSRGEELITPRFPELTDAAAGLSDGTVLDGEVLAWRDGRPLPFSVLQRRIGRLALTDRILAEAPAAFMVYDLLEEDGADVRQLPLSERRARLERVLSAVPSPHPFVLSAPVEGDGWEELAFARADSRRRGVEGLMLKRLASPYRTGRKKGDWWKWKVHPYSVDAVLLYAHPGHGRRANLFTDYTFAVWRGEELVPVAKAYSGLSDAEIAELDGWIRSHTVERFGPVRGVEPTRVFELHFEAIAPSKRHKSGIAVRFPRIARERTDKRPEDADTVESLQALLQATRPPGG